MRIISLLYKLRLEDWKEHYKKDIHDLENNIFHVTDLVRCPLKRIYERKYPELTLQNLLYPKFILGDLVHLGLQYLLRENSERVETEVEVERRIRIPEMITSLTERRESTEAVIKGRIDVLINNEVIYEIKFSNNDLSIPKPHHKLQVMLYKWLIDSSEAFLIYITPERITEFEVSEVLTDDEVANLVKECMNCMKVPRYEWECKYCIFRGICNKVVK